MSASATARHARRGSRGELAGALTILLGLLLSLVAVLATAQPAFAVTACSGDSNTTDAQRVFLEFGGTTDGTFDGTDYLDSDEDACSEAGGNDITFDAYPGVLVHISCSSDLSGDDQINFPGLGPVTDYWVNSVNNGGQTAGSCQPLDSFPDPAEPSGTLACDEVEPGQFSISYTLDKDGSTDQFDLTGPSGVTDLAEASTLTVIVSDAADGAYAITGTDATLAVDGDCATLTPPTPLVSLVKDAVVGEGSDLVAGDPNPLLQFSSSDTGSKTALYSYLITNTGDEPLINLALTDNRIAAGDLDMGDCPEVLGVGDSCTATGSEDFSRDAAEGVVEGDGTVTNTGTVTANGQESGDEVDATDPATIAFEVVFSEVQERDDPDPAPDVEADAEEQPAPVVQAAADELPATGLDDEGLLPVSLLLIAIGAAILWLDRPWLGVR